MNARLTVAKFYMQPPYVHTLSSHEWQQIQHSQFPITILNNVSTPLWTLRIIQRTIFSSRVRLCVWVSCPLQLVWGFWAGLSSWRQSACFLQASSLSVWSGQHFFLLIYEVLYLSFPSWVQCWKCPLHANSSPSYIS